MDKYIAPSDNVLLSVKKQVDIGGSLLDANVFVFEIFWPDQSPIKEAKAFLDFMGAHFTGSAVSESASAEELAQLAIQDLITKVNDIKSALHKI